jgi:hypothetical protein
MALRSVDLFIAYQRAIVELAAQLTPRTGRHSTFRDEQDYFRDEADRPKHRRGYLAHGAVHYIPVTHRGGLHEPHTLGLR